MIADAINGTFEGGGSLLVLLNVYRLWKDKKVMGVSMIPAAFWTLWGYWNLYYYPHLNQWWSFTGGLGVVFGNSAWLALALYYTYWRKE